MLAKEEVELVLLDLMLPDISGLEVLKRIRAEDPDQVVVVITAFSSIEGAIEAMREGAFHYIPKPFKNEEVLLTIRHGLERRRLTSENRSLRSELRQRYGFDNIIGKSKPMQKVFELIQLAAPAKSNILILGESGTGKELVSKAIHHHSRRAAGPIRDRQLGIHARRPAREQPLRTRQRAFHRGRRSTRRDCSSSRIAARSSSTRSATFRSTPSPSCCG